MLQWDFAKPASSAPGAASGVALAIFSTAGANRSAPFKGKALDLIEITGLFGCGSQKPQTIDNRVFDLNALSLLVFLFADTASGRGGHFTSVPSLQMSTCSAILTRPAFSEPGDMRVSDSIITSKPVLPPASWLPWLQLN